MDSIKFPLDIYFKTRIKHEWLYSAAEVLLVASELIGKKGQIEIDSRIYSHNINMEESDKKWFIYSRSKWKWGNF